MKTKFILKEVTVDKEYDKSGQLVVVSKEITIRIFGVVIYKSTLKVI